MKVYTESGAIYDIDSGNVCRKYRDGKLVDSFKAFFIRPVPDSVTEFKEIFELPEDELKPGDRLYISGKDAYWLSTKIDRIEY